MPYRYSILLVDDDPHLIELLNHAAQQVFPEASFFQVTSAAEAIAYIETLEGYGPRLVLLDLNLSSADNGLHFLSFLRANENTRFLPVVILTVSNLYGDIENSYALGVSAFTIKPTRLDEWVDYVRNLRNYWFDTVTLPAIVFNKNRR
ncbi:response regulator [Spirosoma sp. KCTC 42546]|uniref:response regulator n=1 Tax=Spirosoma sp. KCTC 42546 TaxID=2520506 RepID=UPI00115A3345|nr:response regulator [Spirosoma sp. KCTC 42546]QDK80205.1 response regulator [Spirosoma sp. KCTC 42546]